MKKNIIVNGGNGALGRPLVDLLAVEGHCVAVVDLVGSPVGTSALSFCGVDVNNVDEVRKAYGDIHQRLGEVHGVVNLVGGFAWETLSEGAVETWDAMYRTNLRSAVVSCKEALQFLRRGGGSIVNVGAAAAASPGTGLGAYAASKAGILSLTRSLAEEAREWNVRVNAVVPTIIDTPANRASLPEANFGEWVRPESVARVISFLLSEAAGSISGEAVRLSLPG